MHQSFFFFKQILQWSNLNSDKSPRVDNINMVPWLLNKWNFFTLVAWRKSKKVFQTYLDVYKQIYLYLLRGGLKVHKFVLLQPNLRKKLNDSLQT